MSCENPLDINEIAYKTQEDELKRNHMGKWVAFVDGRLVVSEEDKETFFKILKDVYAEKPAFVHRVGDDEIVDLGGALEILD